jgi:hypothetical protein
VVFVLAKNELPRVLKYMQATVRDLSGESAGSPHAMIGVTYLPWCRCCGH